MRAAGALPRTLGLLFQAETDLKKRAKAALDADGRGANSVVLVVHAAMVSARAAVSLATVCATAVCATGVFPLFLLDVMKPKLLIPQTPSIWN